ncbi:MAG: OsmC family protein [Bacteroidota bacterium]
MKIHLKRQNKAFHFVAENEDGVQINLDSSPDAGGENLGFRPMQTLLAGIAGCSAIDIGLILQKQRQVIDDFQIKVTASRVDTIPKIFKEVYIEYILTGDLDSDKVQRAINLSLEKYCSVAKIMEKTARIHTSFSIIQPDHA